MFDELLGLPAHPLLVHAAVVFGPLLVLAVAVYALVPLLRTWLGWVVVALAVTAPAALWFARLSGNALRQMLVDKGYPPQILNQVQQHQQYGQQASLYGILLGVLSLALVWVCTADAERPDSTGRSVIRYGLIVITLAAAAVTGYYVFKTGDTGATIVWGSF